MAVNHPEPIDVPIGPSAPVGIVEPRETSSWAPMWTELKRTPYLSQQKYKIELLAAQPFRIVITAGGAPLIIALNDSRDDSNAIWHWLLEYVLPRVLAKTNSDDAAIRKALSDSITRQRRQLVAESNVFAYKFKLPGEKLVASWPCSLWRAIPRKGTSYVSSNYMCFSSVMLGEEIIIEFNNVEQLEKLDYRGIANTLLRVLCNGEEYIFAVLFERDEMYDVMETMWHQTMSKLQKRNAFPSSTASTIAGNDSPPVSRDAMPSPSRESLRRIKSNEHFCALFLLPESEVCNHVYSCKLKDVDVDNKHGKLYISTNFVCWIQTPYPKGVLPETRLVIPFRDIKSIQRGKNRENEEYREYERLGVLPDIIVINTRIHTHAFHFCLVNRDKVRTDMVKLWKQIRTANATLSSLKSFLNPERLGHNITKELLADATKFSSTYCVQEKLQEEALWAYLTKHGMGLSILFTPGLREIVRGGIPNSMRGYMWMLTSGAAYTLAKADRNFYKSLCESKSNKEAIDEIEKDVHRSLPGHPFFARGAVGIVKLRRVLTAYACYNPSIGYCQAMNIVCAHLLLFLSEEEAFYALCSLCESVPDYYDRELTGSVVDLSIFDGLFQEHLPQVHNHLIKINAQV